MSTSEDLYDVFDKLHHEPGRELCRLATTLWDSDDPLIAALKSTSGNPTVVPEEVVLFLQPLLDSDFEDKPLAWHFARATARLQNPFRPALTHQATTALELALRVAEQVGVAAQGFLLPGLRALEPSPWLLDHLTAEFCTAALDLIVFSGRLRPTAMPTDLAAMAVREVVAQLEAGGIRTQDRPDEILLPGHEDELHTYARWLQELLQGRDDALELLVGMAHRFPLAVRTEHHLELLEDGDFEVNGQLWTAAEVYEHFRSDGIFPEQRLPRGPIPRTLCDTAEVKFPTDPDRAGKAAANLMRSQPQFAGIVGMALHKMGDDLSAEQLGAIAGTSSSLLGLVAQRWPSVLNGSSALVEPTMRIAPPVQRVPALLALGEPARKALAETTDDILAALPGGGTAAALVNIADSSALLNLSFWEKRLHHRYAFETLHRSNRLQACWKLRPSGLVRALRKLTRDESTEDALGILAWLHQNARQVLPAQSSTVIELLQQAVPEHWNHGEELEVLAYLDTPEARTRIAAIIGTTELDEDVAVRAGIQHDTLWSALSAKERVNPYLVVEHLYSGTASQIQVTSAAARAVIIHIINHGLLDLSDAAAANPELLAEAVFWHRSEGEARLIAKHLLGFESIRFDDEHRSPPGTIHHDANPAWLDSLLDCDRAALLEEIGALCAWRHSEAPWREHIPQVLGDALRARCRVALDPHGDAILSLLADRWPTRSRLESAAAELDIALDPKALDRCADEGLPPLFRAAVADLYRSPSSDDDVVWTPAETCLNWIMETAWVEDPALVSRHLVGELCADRPEPWLRGVALALVALREPIGTTVPDALTRVAHELPSSKAFLLKQRDTFSRSSAAAERAKPAQFRTRQALIRLRLAARNAARME